MRVWRIKPLHVCIYTLCEIEQIFLQPPHLKTCCFCVEQSKLYCEFKNASINLSPNSFIVLIRNKRKLFTKRPNIVEPISKSQFLCPYESQVSCSPLITWTLFYLVALLFLLCLAPPKFNKPQNPCLDMWWSCTRWGPGPCAPPQTAGGLCCWSGACPSSSLCRWPTPMWVKINHFIMQHSQDAALLSASCWKIEQLEWMYKSHLELSAHDQQPTTWCFAILPGVQCYFVWVLKKPWNEWRLALHNHKLLL